MTVAERTLLINARVIDGNGGAPQDGRALLVSDERIEAIARAGDISTPEGASVIDLAGRTLLPGFIDCHVHILGNPDPRLALRASNIPLRDAAYLKGRSLLQGAIACRLTLDAGFTTIRDLGAPNEVFALRDSVNAGEHIGPRLLSSGKGITHTGGHGAEYDNDMAHIADGADETLRAVRLQIAAGADAIKIIGGTRPALSPPFRGRAGYATDELQRAVAEARAAGVKVAAHAHSHTGGIKNCIRAGVDSIEHGFPLDEEAADMMAERGVFLCPTLSVTPAARRAIEEGLWTYPGSEAQIRRMEGYARDTIALARRAGVKVALGTDAAMPLVFHGANADEFALMAEYGMTPMEAIVAGTRNAAENVGLGDEIGSLEVGKAADMVAVDGDPLADIGALRDARRIRLVVKAGAIVKNSLGAQG